MLFINLDIMAVADDDADSKYGKRHYQIHDGYLFPSLTTKEWFDDVRNNFKPRDSDIFVSSFPKSGTNWLCHIMEVLRTGKPIDGPLEKKNVDLDFPQLDALTEEILSEFGEYSKRIPLKSEVENLPAPRLFFTHMPYEHIPKNPSAKYLYIYRNPKDVLISAYHHFSGMRIPQFEGTFAQFFNLFTDTGVVGQFKHIKGFLEHRNEPNVFVLSYEELHRDFKKKVGEIAEFMCYQFNEDVYNVVAKETNFEAMLNNKLTNRASIMREGLQFLRKGIVGDWKTALTEKQSQRIDEIMKENLPEEFIKKFMIFE